MGVKLVLLLASCLVAVTSGTDYIDFYPWPRRSSTVLSVDFQDCPAGQSPCMVDFNAKYNITIKFQYTPQTQYERGPSNLFSFASLVYANEYGSPKFDGYDYFRLKSTRNAVAYIVDDENPCANGGLDCSLTTGTVYTYTGTVELFQYQLLNYALIIDLRNPDRFAYIPFLAVRINLQFSYKYSDE